MRFVLVGLGSAGDVAPLIPLGQRLLGRGHDVVVAGLDPYLVPVGAAGVPAASLGDVAWFDPAAGAWSTRLSLAQPGLQYASLSRRIASMSRDVAERLEELAAPGSVLVPGTVTLGACAQLARRRGAVSVPLLLAPLLPSGDAAASALATPGLPPALARAQSSLLWQLTRRLGSSVTRAVAERCGTVGIPSPEPATTLVASSPVLTPPRWDRPGARQTGAFVPPPSAPATLPADLLAFLADGPAPVLMTFGSAPSLDGHGDLDLLRRGVALGGERVLLQSSHLPPGRVCAHVWNLGFVDHAALLPRLAGIVHHGGAGTTVAGLLAGLPTGVVPHLGDQLYFGRRVHALGAGPRPIPRWRLTPSGLGSLIASVADPSRGHASAARDLGDRLAREDGVGFTVGALERAASRP